MQNLKISNKRTEAQEIFLTNLISQLLSGQSWDLGLYLDDSNYCTTTACTILDTLSSQGDNNSKSKE